MREQDLGFDPYGQAAEKAGPGRRGLTGDRQILYVNGDRRGGNASMMIDFEVAFPQPFLIVVQITDLDNPSSGTVATFKVETGVDRDQLDADTFDGAGFQRVVLARSVSVTVTNGDPANPSSYVPAPRLDVRAIAVPLQVTADSRMFGSGITTNQVPSIDMITDPVNGVPRSETEEVTIGAATSLGLAHRGLTVFNDSAENVYLALGDAVTLTAYTVILVPGAYYETPFQWSGPVTARSLSGASVVVAVTRIYS